MIKIWTTTSLRNTQSATDATVFLNDPKIEFISMTSESSFDPGNGIWHTIYIAYKDLK
jgi:hypothetical protein